MTMTPALRVLLDAEAGFAPAYAGGLANHRAMTLHALARLGAPDTRLQAWARGYESRLLPAPPPARWPAGQPWADYLGRPECWPIYRDLFTEWLEHEAAGDVLQQALPRLMKGVAASAFHGLIRTAHATAAAHRTELADALAYWAAHWLPLGQALPEIEPVTDDPEVVLRQLRRVKAADGFISTGLRTAAAQPGFDRLAAQLALGPETLPRLARLAAMAYAASGNFTVLHLVTGSLAMQELLPFLDPDDPAPAEAALAAYWRACVAAVAAAGIEPSPAPAPLDWPALKAGAIAAEDEHVIKLVDACAEHERRQGPGPWRAAATRALQP
jgi:hypothetical protein